MGHVGEIYWLYYDATAKITYCYPNQFQSSIKFYSVSVQWFRHIMDQIPNWRATQIYI